LPEDIEKAWTAARAEIGWIRITPDSRPDFVTLLLDVETLLSYVLLPGQREFAPPHKGTNGDIPTFRLRVWQVGLLAKLPEPQVAHGLDLTKLPLTDKWLVDLRGLRSLQTLNLAGTLVTDAGLNELAGLKNLQVLDLGAMRITDAGVAELKKALPNCQSIR
jgi:hypothetical protein